MTFWRYPKQPSSDGTATIPVVTLGTDWSAVTNKPTTFTPPTASASVLGGVKIGSGISVDVNGVISASGGSTNATQIQGKAVAVPSTTNTLARFNGTSIDWIPTPAGGSLKTIEDYGAVAGADTTQPVASVMTANLNAINTMLTNEGYAIIPAEVYWINGSINVRGGQQLLGFGRNQSFLYVASGANYAAVDIGNVDGAKVSSFGVIYNDWNPEAYTNRNAFYFHDEVRDSEFDDLYAQSIYRAFYLDDTSSAQHNLWSCNFRNLKCYWYAKNMFYFNPQIGGNTGCVFENIYAHNGTRDNRKAEIVTPFNFQKFTESVCLQLNAEWSNVENCFFLQSNRNMVFISTHIEGVDAKTANGLVHVVDGAAHFLTLDIYDVNFDSGGQNGIFRVNYGGLLKVEGLTETASTLVSGSVTGIISETVAGKNDRIEITGSRPTITSNFFPTVNVNSTINLPKLIRYNDEVYYQKVGLNVVSSGTAAPTTGTWARGDKVYNSTPAASGYTGWVCVTAGTPGTWKGFGVIQA